MKSYLYTACAALLVAGCTTPDVKKVDAQVAKPVNCSTAEGDLRALNAEKAHVTSEIANGVASIVPVSAIVNTAEGTEKTRFEVGTGEYNAMIDKRIAQIKNTCGLK